MDAGGQSVLDRTRTGIDVELPGKPHLSARGGIGNLRGDHPIRFQPTGISAACGLRRWFSDGQRAVASDQSNDVTGEEYGFPDRLNELHELVWQRHHADPGRNLLRHRDPPSGAKRAVSVRDVRRPHVVDGLRNSARHRNVFASPRLE